MSYTLMVSEEEQKRIEICDAFTCFGKHLRVTRPDSMGKVFPYLNSKCQTCSSADRCQVMKRLVDAWLNNEAFNGRC